MTESPENDNPAHTLLRAANALGSSEQLAHVLHVPIDQLRTWMRGEEAPPQDVLERAARIIKSQKPIPR